MKVVHKFKVFILNKLNNELQDLKVNENNNFDSKASAKVGIKHLRASPVETETIKLNAEVPVFILAKKDMVNKAKQLKSAIEREILEQKDPDEIKIGCDLRSSQPGSCRTLNSDPHLHISHDLMTA